MANETDELATLRGRVKELEVDCAAMATVHAQDEIVFNALRAENARLKRLTSDLHTATTALLAWVDAVPADTPLPPMPGIDRDWVNEVVHRTALARTIARDTLKELGRVK
jgi:hypothetical protein